MPGKIVEKKSVQWRANQAYFKFFRAQGAMDLRTGKTKRLNNFRLLGICAQGM